MARHAQSTLPVAGGGVEKANLHESLPSLPIESHTDRNELVRRLERLCDVILPRLASGGGYPVAFDHCFRRIAYDVACGHEWTDEIDRPFIENAHILTLARAYRVAAWMARTGAPAVSACNDASLEYRGVDR